MIDFQFVRGSLAFPFYFRHETSSMPFLLFAAGPYDACVRTILGTIFCIIVFPALLRVCFKPLVLVFQASCACFKPLVHLFQITIVYRPSSFIITEFYRYQIIYKLKWNEDIDVRHSIQSSELHCTIALGV